MRFAVGRWHLVHSFIDGWGWVNQADRREVWLGEVAYRLGEPAHARVGAPAGSYVIEQAWHDIEYASLADPPRVPIEFKPLTRIYMPRFARQTPYVDIRAVLAADPIMMRARHMNEKTAAMEAIQARMGWTDDTLFTFALRFLADSGMTEGFEEYLEEHAAEEDAECRAAGTGGAEAEESPKDDPE
jgi:hypothetical protein